MSLTGGREDGYDLGAMGDKLNLLADDLRRQADQLRQAVDTAAEGTYQAESPDGLVRVTVNGRRRVTAVDISPHALRYDPDTLDGMLTGALGDALGQARSGAQEALLDSLPPGLRGSIETAVDEARREDGR
jgi:DNA-binding protein YbaB